MCFHLSNPHPSHTTTAAALRELVARRELAATELKAKFATVADAMGSLNQTAVVRKIRAQTTQHTEEGGPEDGGGGGGGGAEGAPQAAQFELKPVPWAAFLARYRAAGQQAEAGGAQAAGAGGAGGDAGARLGEFLAFGVPEDKLLCCVLAYL